MNRLPLLFALILAGLSSLRGQELLYAERGGKMLLVRKVEGVQPFVEENGKMVPASRDRFALRPYADFLPAFVAIRDLEVQVKYLQVLGSGAQLNNDFDFSGKFESPFPLDDVFLVLELHMERYGRVLFVHEVGRLRPREPKPMHLVVPLRGPLGPGKYQVHVFVGGMETLHSLQPFDVREAALDRMVRKKIADRPDGPPQFFVGPPPAYPPAFRKAKLSGRVVVRLRVRANGAVADPVVRETTDPALSEPTIEAVRLWRFLPEMRHGRPVDATVDLPLEFEPPAS